MVYNRTTGAGAGVYLVRLLADGQRAEHKVIVVP
jgi:hypothetical protein